MVDKNLLHSVFPLIPDQFDDIVKENALKRDLFNEFNFMERKVINKDSNGNIEAFWYNIYLNISLMIIKDSEKEFRLFFSSIWNRIDDFILLPSENINDMYGEVFKTLKLARKRIEKLVTDKEFMSVFFNPEKTVYCSGTTVNPKKYVMGIMEKTKRKSKIPEIKEVGIDVSTA